MMKIYVQELDRRPIKLDESRPPDKMDTGELDFQIVEPVDMELTLEKMKREVLGRGTISARVKPQCCRCLQDFEIDLDTKVHVRFISRDKLDSDLPEDLADKDLNVFYHDPKFIDIDELIRENLILALPFKLLCQEDCKGLCPQCGANLNKTTCDCPPIETGDPRMAQLKKLLDPQEQESK